MITERTASRRTAPLCGDRRILAIDAEFAARHPPAILSYSRVALPRDRCHFAGSDVDLERATPADGALLLFHRYGVVTRRQRNAKSTLIIGCEGSDDALLAFYDESNLCQWTRIGNAFSAGPRMDRGNGNHAFDSCPRFGLCLSPRKAGRHHEEDQRNWDSASLHSH
jgi:hypothetical protein